MYTYWKNSNPPRPPYYAVIFVSQKSQDTEGYQEMDDFLMEQAQKQPGFLGYSSKMEEKGGIFISYWESREAIDNWRHHSTHQKAKQMAREKWYQYFHSLITKVESSQEFGESLL